MRGHRFLVVIAHPIYGRIKRLHVPHAALHFAVAGILIAAVAGFGFTADYFRRVTENDRLAAQNRALQAEYDSLLVSVEERDQQLDFLRDMANQVSIAYGIQRTDSESSSDVESDWIPAYYESRDQYDRLHDVLTDIQAGLPVGSWMVNKTPSIWPVKGWITSSYGKRQDPFNGEGSFHPGIDISSSYGAPVVATADGYVVYAKWAGGLGKCIKIRHGRGGYSTVYGHLKEYFVRTGQSVRRGEVIGQVGSSGRTTGQHVHYEVHYRGLKYNPYRFLKSKRSTYDVMLAD